MNTNARNWRVVLGGVAAGSAAVIGFAGTNASAEPVVPAPPVPAPVTVTQTVTVTPDASAPTTSVAPSLPAGTETLTPAAPAPTAAAATTPAAAAQPTQPALAPATSGTIAEFLKDKGVALEPQKAAGFTALNIVLPVPAGWSVVPDPNVPDAFGVIADRKGGDGLYTSNAQLLVYKLNGDFDAREAISHGFVDSQKLRSWQSTSASMAEFGGFPSAIISGTYRDGDMVLNTSRRYVIAKSGADQYLLSLSVTTAANQAVAAATATDGILTGFRVTDPAAVPAAPAAPAPAEPAPAPAPAPAEPGIPPVSVVVPAPAVDPATAVVATVPTP